MISPFVAKDDAVCVDNELPEFKLDPRTTGYASSFAHATNIPGFWNESSSGFSQLLLVNNLNRPDFKLVSRTK